MEQKERKLKSNLARQSALLNRVAPEFSSSRGSVNSRASRRSNSYQFSERNPNAPRGAGSSSALSFYADGTSAEVEGSASLSPQAPKESAQRRKMRATLQAMEELDVHDRLQIRDDVFKEASRIRKDADEGEESRNNLDTDSESVSADLGPSKRYSNRAAARPASARKSLKEKRASSISNGKRGTANTSVGGFFFGSNTVIKNTRLSVFQSQGKRNSSSSRGASGTSTTKSRSTSKTAKSSKRKSPRRKAVSLSKSNMPCDETLQQPLSSKTNRTSSLSVGGEERFASMKIDTVDEEPDSGPPCFFTVHPPSSHQSLTSEAGFRDSGGEGNTNLFVSTQHIGDSEDDVDAPSDHLSRRMPHLNRRRSSMISDSNAAFHSSNSTTHTE